MQELDDSALLREYVERDSEEAFAALVTRHVNKVYSVALRLTGNPHSAEEITQAVFVILARKSRQLGKRVILSGWLYQTARLTAVTFIRGGIRRARREQEACMQTALNENESEAWRQIALLLDAAMAGLNETDRHAVVLRFFDGKSLREVGAALGANEEAAKKRVSRALEKLHHYFAKRGVSSTTAIIAGAISANSVQAAPVALAKSVTAIAVAKGAAASGSTLTLIKGALKIMAWTKMKTAIVVGVGVLLAAGTTTTAFYEIENHRTYSWEVPKADFEVFYKSPPQVRIVPTKFSVTNGGWVCDSSRGAMGIAQSVEDIVHAAYQQDKLRTVITAEMPQGRYDFFAKLVPPQEPRKNIPTDEAWAKKLQDLIRGKFGITGRLENRKTDVLLLKLNNPTIQGFKTADSLRKSLKLGKGTAIRPGPGQFAAFNQPIHTLNSFLERRLKMPIVDRTAMTNEYDFIVKWDESDPKQPDNDALKKALADQLGLELVPGREPIEMLVVEKVK